MGAEPVYLSNSTELAALMGQRGYDALVEHCERRARDQHATAMAISSLLHVSAATEIYTFILRSNGAVRTGRVVKY